MPESAQLIKGPSTLVADADINLTLKVALKVTMNSVGWASPHAWDSLPWLLRVLGFATKGVDPFVSEKSSGPFWARFLTIRQQEWVAAVCIYWVISRLIFGLGNVSG